MLVKAGDTVTDETILMEVQNDKAVVEVPCPVEGKIVSVAVKDGQVCTIGELVMTIEVTGEMPAASMHHGSSHAAPAVAVATPPAAAPAPAAVAAPAAAP